MRDHTIPTTHQRADRHADIRVEAPLVAAKAPAGGRTAPARAESVTVDDEQRAARRLVLWTLAGTVIAAGAIEWAGWQVVHRYAETSTFSADDVLGVPRAQWGLGLVRNAGAALGVGIGMAGFAALLPWARKRPWRALSAAFAVGSLAVLVGLAALTAWAP
jgi:hypothetical protein